MEHIKLLQQLQIREKELVKELNAIKALMDVYLNNQDITIERNNESNIVTGENGIKAKGKMNWDRYTILLLREIGGRGKTSDVTEAAIKANPDIDKKTIKSAIRSKLSNRYRDGFLTAEKGNYKKDGYTYILDPNRTIRTK